MFNPLPLNRKIAFGENADPDDVVITKRALQLLGHLEDVPDQVNQFSDANLFRGIRSFQHRNGLKPDGVMNPEGPTASFMGISVQKALDSSRVAASPQLEMTTAAASNPTGKNCDYLYWEVDIPACRAILVRRGKRAAARCFFTATARYAACLRGRPPDQRPPLDVWDQ